MKLTEKISSQLREEQWDKDHLTLLKKELKDEKEKLAKHQAKLKTLKDEMKSKPKGWESPSGYTAAEVVDNKIDDIKSCKKRIADYIDAIKQGSLR